MNNIDSENFFPDNLTDTAAAALSEFLHNLAEACESRYFIQLSRYYESKRTVYDPEQPWRSPPPDP